MIWKKPKSFDESWCERRNCPGGDSKAQCDRCKERAMEEDREAKGESDDD